MRKSKHISIVVHMPEDKKSFEKIYIEAAFEAINLLAQIAKTIPEENNKSIDASTN